MRFGQSGHDPFFPPFTAVYIISETDRQCNGWKRHIANGRTRPTCRSSSLPPFLRRLSTRDRRFESTGEDHMSHYFTRCRTTEIRAFEARCRGGMSRHPREWAGCSPVSRPFRACPPSTPDIHQTSLGRPARQAAIMALTPIKEFAS